MNLLFVGFVILAMMSQFKGDLPQIKDTLRNKLRSFSVIQKSRIIEALKENEVLALKKQELEMKEQQKAKRKMEEKRRKIFKEYLEWRAGPTSVLKDLMSRF